MPLKCGANFWRFGEIGAVETFRARAANSGPTPDAAARALPGEWLQEPFRPKRQVKTRFERVPRHAAKPLGKSGGIAIVATGANLGASRDRAPGRISPFDC